VQDIFNLARFNVSAKSDFCSDNTGSFLSNTRAALGLLLATEMTRDVFNEMSDPPWLIQWEGQKCFFSRET
jgi:hypothetical protein